MSNRHSIILLAGARPNYMKIFPLWKALSEDYKQIKPVIVHTGQHYDALMSDAFFKDLDMPEPDHFLGVGSGKHGAQTGRIMIELESLFEKIKPDLLVVVGDVNSTLAGALVAAKLGIPVAHVEAGLRSHDRTMPEEINRLVTDSISDYLFTSCREADENLKREGVDPDRIFFVGNIMIDSLQAMLPQAAKSGILQTLNLDPQTYFVVTLHRPANVDAPDQLRKISDLIKKISKIMPAVFPVHPRTRKSLEPLEIGGAGDRVKLIEPLGYLDFLRVMSQSAFVLTDSGGIQEETTYLGKPCLTVRPNTERPITVQEGTNRLVDSASMDLAEIVKEILSEAPTTAPEIELWDGKSAGRICAVLDKILASKE